MGGVSNFAPLAPAMNNSNAVAVSLDATCRMSVFAYTGPNRGPAVHIRGVVLGNHE